MRISSTLLQRSKQLIDKYALYVPKTGSFPKGFEVGYTASGVKKKREPGPGCNLEYQ